MREPVQNNQDKCKTLLFPVPYYIIINPVFKLNEKDVLDVDGSSPCVKTDGE